MDHIPNLHRIWPVYKHLRNPSYQKPLCKIATVPTTEPLGFTNWHVLALGILPLCEMERFLRSTLDQRPSVVFDDLFEHITAPLPFWWVNHHANAGVLPDNMVGYDIVGLGVEELCRLQNLSLLGHYLHEGVLALPMNPAVLLFEKWISDEIHGVL
jgi:hypothetical protein